jgi:hypothetical protein
LLADASFVAYGAALRPFASAAGVVFFLRGGGMGIA